MSAFSHKTSRKPFKVFQIKDKYQTYFYQGLLVVERQLLQKLCVMSQELTIMLSTDRMKEDFSTPLEIRPKTLHQLFPSPVIQNIKSLSSMRQTTPHTMSNFSSVRISRSFMEIADSSSPVIIRTKSSNPSTPDVQSSSSESEENKNKKQQHRFLIDL